MYGSPDHRPKNRFDEEEEPEEEKKGRERGRYRRREKMKKQQFISYEHTLTDNGKGGFWCETAKRSDSKHYEP